MKRKSGKSTKIYSQLLLIVILPILILALGVMFFSHYRISSIIYEEIEDNLKNVACSMNTHLDLEYPGDYRMFGTDSLVAFKGTEVLNDRFEYIDEVKSDSGTEISLFLKDVRILSTIADTDGKRILGTQANFVITNTVENNGSAHFFRNISIGNDRYYAYYLPVFNADGSCVGMIGVAKLAAKVRQLIFMSVLPMILMTIAAGAIAMYICAGFAGRLAKKITGIQGFMKSITDGNLYGVMDKEVLTGEDELSEIAQSAVAMQESLRKLVDEDPLTELYNRRYSNKQLRANYNKAKDRDEVMSVVIGDIDHFKKVNDTYGHEAGDVILKNVAKILKDSMIGNGFAARWGGEEFLLCFVRSDAERTGLLVEEILDKIRALDSYHDDRLIKVTMSFGVADISEADLNGITPLADERLYFAKEHGRNQVISSRHQML